MRTNLSKKLLAAVLSLAMVLSLVGIQPSNANAASYKITKKAEMKAGKTVTYKVTGVKKTQYIKVTKKNANVTVKYNNKKVSTSKKIAGTGKALSLKVTAKEVNKDYTNKMTVKIYNKKNNKVVKTLTVSTKVLTQVKEEEPTPEEPTPEEPVVEEATLVSLEATGSKELTATLSKEVAGLTEKDFTVKKGTVKVTPASVKVEGTKVVIALGSKIAEGTYSVTYKESTVEVKTEDEKVVKFATVGENLCQTKVPAEDYNYYDAEIEFQALNQYSEATAATVLSAVTSVGGKVDVENPTAKKNGVLKVSNITPSLGVVGTNVTITIVSDKGVSNACPVIMSSARAVKKVEVVGIYCKSKGEYVDVLPADKQASDYVLDLNIFDQYNNNVNGLYDSILVAAESKTGSNTLDQVGISTNLRVGDGTTAATKFVATNALDVIEFADGNDHLVAKLITKDGSKLATGSLRLMLTTTQGLALDYTMSVSEPNMVKSISITAEDAVYNKDKNYLSYTVIGTNGEEIKDYKTLNRLMPTTSPSSITDADGTELQWEKQTDGTAKLVYTPNHAFDTADKNDKSTTPITITATANAAEYGAVTKVTSVNTLTISEQRHVAELVKYTGNKATSGHCVYVSGSYFVIEDQYGNVITSKNFYDYANIKLDYVVITYDNAGKIVGVPAIVKGTSLTSFATTCADSSCGNCGYPSIAVTDTNPRVRVYVALADDKVTASNVEEKVTAFEKDALSITFEKADSFKATNITATYSGDDWGYIAQVSENQSYSPISLEDFYFEGYVNGKKIDIPSEQVSILSDSYTEITKAEKETAVKEATVVFNVVLKNDNGEQYTTTVEGKYKYSAKTSVATQIVNPTVFTGASAYSDVYGYYTANQYTSDDLRDVFTVKDQYFNNISNEDLTYEISLGKNTSGLTVENPGLNTALVTGFTGSPNAELVVTASYKNNIKNTVKIIVAKVADSTWAEDSKFATVKTVDELTKAVDAGKTKITFKTTSSAKVVIPSYSKGKNIDLVVDAENATVENNSAWKSVTIKAVAADTYVENAKNEIKVEAKNPVHVVANVAATKITVATDAKVELEANAAVELEIADNEAKIELSTNEAVAPTVTLTAAEGTVLSNVKVVSDKVNTESKLENFDVLNKVDNETAARINKVKTYLTSKLTVTTSSCFSVGSKEAFMNFLEAQKLTDVIAENEEKRLDVKWDYEDEDVFQTVTITFLDNTKMSVTSFAGSVEGYTGVLTPHGIQVQTYLNKFAAQMKAKEGKYELAHFKNLDDAYVAIMEAIKEQLEASEAIKGEHHNYDHYVWNLTETEGAKNNWISGDQKVTLTITREGLTSESIDMVFNMAAAK